MGVILSWRLWLEWRKWAMRAVGVCRPWWRRCRDVYRDSYHSQSCPSPTWPPSVQEGLWVANIIQKEKSGAREAQKLMVWLIENWKSLKEGEEGLCFRRMWVLTHKTSNLWFGVCTGTFQNSKLWVLFVLFWDLKCAKLESRLWALFLDQHANLLLLSAVPCWPQMPKTTT